MKMAPNGMNDQQDAEPARKRVHFASILDANQVIKMSIVSGDQEPHMTFAPEFTYHVVGKEQTIEGFDHLNVSILFNAFDFSCLVEIQSKDEHDRTPQLIDAFREQLKPSLPHEITSDRDAFLQHLRSSRAHFSPPGRRVKSYTRDATTCSSSRSCCVEPQEPEETFEIYECPFENNAKASQLHENLQKTSRWFIEGADDIDVQDPRWVLYLIYKVVNSTGRTGGSNESNSTSSDGGNNHGKDNPANMETRALQLVGYTTLFKFHNPLGRRALESHQDETHRICQVLVFPPFQRQGHGQVLIKTINAIAIANPKVYEITVEDPVPGFQKLRDFLDVCNCLEHKFFHVAPSDSQADPKLPLAHGTHSLSNEAMQQVQKTLKLTQRQVQRCYEILKFRFVNKQNEAELKPFRLEVKKRLFKQHAEDLEAMASSERRKAFLEKEFQELVEYYESLLKRLSRSHDTDSSVANSK